MHVYSFITQVDRPQVKILRANYKNDKNRKVKKKLNSTVYIAC